jgi:hypothetical protein
LIGTQRDHNGKGDDDNDREDVEDDGNELSIDPEDERLQRIDDRDIARAEEDEDANHAQNSMTAHDIVNTEIVRWVDDEDDDKTTKAASFHS